jgi:CheY-like chemotaxis protein
MPDTGVDPPVILVVDDEIRILSALRRSLRREGYRILIAEDGASALRILDETPVDLILSDQKMPGMSGLELLEQVEERRLPAVRILLTGWPEEIPPARKTALGIRAVLLKPWDDGTLKRVLRQALAPGGAPSTGRS